jgi:hypothetical protein
MFSMVAVTCSTTSEGGAKTFSWSVIGLPGSFGAVAAFLRERRSSDEEPAGMAKM